MVKREQGFPFYFRWMGFGIAVTSGSVSWADIYIPQCAARLA
jgi:hypothetical protein